MPKVHSLGLRWELYGVLGEICLHTNNFLRTTISINIDDAQLIIFSYLSIRLRTRKYWLQTSKDLLF
ncbi:hypothetical protein EB796_019530 [Bugula neritina]|uniref:Uncharacterized protein n=1 Tax=Bugula neritina TaxID=10212 RepID=A0A7J7J804_BUGNE|nr:hypothetical protein EB796_019530 [Bugula neritina]